MKDLTHLSASKDLSTYSQLQQIPSTAQIKEVIREVKANYDPSLMDDASVAERLSEQYRDAGKDPSLAFSQEDLAEFGFFPEGG